MQKSLKYCPLLIFLMLLSNLMIFLCLNRESLNQNSKLRNVNPQVSWIWASLNLTNEYEINGRSFFGGDVIPIKGKVFNRISFEPKPNINVSIFANGKLYLDFSNRTNANGDFTIDFIIPRTIKNNTQIEIWGNVTDTLPGEIEYLNHYVITVLNEKTKTEGINFGSIYIVITLLAIAFLIKAVKKSIK